MTTYRNRLRIDNGTGSPLYVSIGPWAKFFSLLAECTADITQDTELPGYLELEMTDRGLFLHGQWPSDAWLTHNDQRERLSLPEGERYPEGERLPGYPGDSARWLAEGNRDDRSMAGLYFSDSRDQPNPVTIDQELVTRERYVADKLPRWCIAIANAETPPTLIFGKETTTLICSSGEIIDPYG